MLLFPYCMPVPNLVLISQSPHQKVMVMEGPAWKMPKICCQKRFQIINLQTPNEAVEGVDVIYTDTWTSMGQEEETEKRLKSFSSLPGKCGFG